LVGACETPRVMSRETWQGNARPRSREGRPLRVASQQIAIFTAAPPDVTLEIRFEKAKPSLGDLTPWQGFTIFHAFRVALFPVYPIPAVADALWGWGGKSYVIRSRVHQTLTYHGVKSNQSIIHFVSFGYRCWTIDHLFITYVQYAGIFILPPFSRVCCAYSPSLHSLHSNLSHPPSSLLYSSLALIFT